MTTVEIIDELRSRAKRLRDEAEKLDAAAKILNSGASLNGAPAVPTLRRVRLRVRKPKRGTRLDAIKKLVRNEGPLFRREIEQKSDVPKGTISMYLSSKHGFKHLEDGRWTLAEDQKMKV